MSCTVHKRISSSFLPPLLFRLYVIFVFCSFSYFSLCCLFYKFPCLFHIEISRCSLFTSLQKSALFTFCCFFWEKKYPLWIRSWSKENNNKRIKETSMKHRTKLQANRKFIGTYSILMIQWSVCCVHVQCEHFTTKKRKTRVTNSKKITINLTIWSTCSEISLRNFYFI